MKHSQPKLQGPLFLCLICFIVFGLKTIYTDHKSEYLQSYPKDNLIYAQVTFDIDTLTSLGSVGNEWSFNHYLNGRKFNDGDIITINAKSPFVISSEFIENDGIDDIGSATSIKYQYSKNNNYKKTLYINQKVQVDETGGRQNKGSSTTFWVAYKLERVVPDSMGFFDILFFSGDASNKSKDTLWATGIVISVAAIIFAPIYKKRLDAIAAEEQRKKREEQFNIEKNEFIRRLNGQTLRQAAQVPESIVFFAGLPVDNNNSRYGSFTVYLSENGKCYHDKKGCCSSRFPTHYFNAIRRYKPCSKCCTKFRSIPQWYIDYNYLREQAKKYNVFMEE